MFPRSIPLSLFGCILVGAATVQAQSNDQPYAFSTLAGPALGSPENEGDSTGLNFPTGVAVDRAGKVYVADTDNHTVRNITSAGILSTLAGLPGNLGAADGAGSAARFSYPKGVAADGAGNIYVADTVNQIIRKITPAGVAGTLAGMAGRIGSGDGTGRAARFYYPYGVAVDSAANVYVADTFNSTVRKITPLGVVSTLAGLAGNVGSADGAGSAARFNYPSSVAVDGTGNVYVADTGNCTIRKITPAGAVSTFAGLAGAVGSADGAGRGARFNYPHGVAVDGAGYIYVADTLNSTIRKITPARVVSTLAGSASALGNVDGAGDAARFYYPESVAVDSRGDIYVADSNNSDIRLGRATGHLHFEIEELAVQAKSAANYGIARDASASGGAFTFLKGTVPGDFVTYIVPIASAGTYDLRVGIKTRDNKGIFQLAIDGVNQGLLPDEYSPAITYEDRDLGPVTFASPGDKAFQFLLHRKESKQPWLYAGVGFARSPTGFSTWADRDHRSKSSIWDRRDA
jgi:sugar lactone lactonase YvrE